MLLAGLMKSFKGLIVGCGIMGGIGMVSVTRPPLPGVELFGPLKVVDRRVVVGGYGGAALYIALWPKWLIAAWPHRQFCHSGGGFAVL